MCRVKKTFLAWGLKQSLLKIKMSVPKDFFLTFSYIMFATASVAWWHRRVYVCGNGYRARLQCESGWYVRMDQCTPVHRWFRFQWSNNINLQPFVLVILQSIHHHLIKKLLVLAMIDIDEKISHFLLYSNLSLIIIAAQQQWMK